MVASHAVFMSVTNVQSATGTCLQVFCHDTRFFVGAINRKSIECEPNDGRVLLAIVGLVVILVSFMQSRGYSSILNQMDALILALFGLGLIIVGSALYIRSAMTRFLRYWLLRMVYEQRDLARQHTPPLDD